MEYTIQIFEDQKLIHARAKGQWDKQTDDAMIREIMGSVPKMGLKKVMLDMRELQFDMSLTTIFQRAQELRDQRVESKSFTVKVAIVYLSKDRQTEDNFSFFETTARNRGLPYRVFKDDKEAFAWLMESDPKVTPPSTLPA
jgi:hypothetical protein